MPEALGRPFEFSVTPALADRLLGRSLQLGPFQPDVYNERQAIYQRVAARGQQVFEANVAVATADGMTITPEMVEAWPDPATLDNLRQSFLRERKRVGMLDGLDNFIAHLDEDER